MKGTLLLLCSGALFFLRGAENLLPEWEATPAPKTKPALRNWRFSDWGERVTSDRKVFRRNRVTFEEERLTVVLESGPGNRHANVLQRTVPLPGKKGGHFRFQVRLRGAGSRPALVQLRTAPVPGSGRSVRTEFVTVSSEEKVALADFAVPPESTALSLSIALCGSGSLAVSGARLEEMPAPDPPELRISPVTLPGEPVRIPEKSPVELRFTAPPGSGFPPGTSVRVTLPWGIRMAGSSWGSALTDVRTQVKKEVSYRFAFSKRGVLSRELTLLLGTDLRASERELTGSVVLEREGWEKRPSHFRIKVVRDAPAVAPRNFLIAIPGPALSAPDIQFELEQSFLNRGANVFTAANLPIPPDRLRNARIRRFLPFHLNPVKGEGGCGYAKIRNGAFWSEHFLPALKKSLLRTGADASALICDSRLGQARAIDCLCVLCRAELAEFAPKIPRKNAMNDSNGLLLMRFGSEVRRFREARTAALRTGARRRLPAGSGGFLRKPSLFFTFWNLGSFRADALKDVTDAVADCGRRIRLPDGLSWAPAVDFLFAEQVFRTCRKALPKGRIYLQKSLVVHSITPEQFAFELLCAPVCGFAGVFWTFPAGLPYDFYAALGRSAGVIREHEKFFARPPLAKHAWRIECSAPDLTIPPVAGENNYPLPFPEKFRVVQLRVWRQGGETLVGIGNFTDLPQTVRLFCGNAPLLWRGKIDGVNVDKAALAKGVGSTLAPYSWRFFRLTGL